jgi:xanthine dehydrogenase large subunit
MRALRNLDLPPSDGLKTVRKPVPHDSAVRHVQGSAPYIDDLPEPAGTLHAAPGYVAKVAHGRILSVDLDAVRQSPGVVAVLTAADIPGKNDCGPVIEDDPVFATDKIEFYGQVIFAVLATTRDQARRAARLARINVEPLAAAIDVSAALEADLRLQPDYTFRRGKAGEAIARAPRRYAGKMRIGGQEHFYLEGQVSLVQPGEGGEMHVWSSTQHPTEIQHTVAKVLSIPDAWVTVETRRMGGGFGGKESQAAQWAAIAAIGARLTGRPVKMRLDRDDDFIMTGKRHDFLVEHALGFDNDGHVLGYDVTFASRCGYSNDLSSAINDRTMFHADNAYWLPETTITTKRMKTHTVSNTAFRGFGGPQGTVAAERLMDSIAVLTGLDPLDVRKRNFYGVTERNVTPYGMVIEDNVIHELVETLELTSDYRRRRLGISAFNAENRFLKKGLALTPVKFGISFTISHLNQAGALVHVYTDGSIHLNHGGTEMGQGLNQKVAQVTAEVFGVTLDRVKITATHTGKVPNTSPTAASSGSDMNGWAARNAAMTIRDRLVAFACETWGVTVDAVAFVDDKVRIGSAELSFPDFVKKAYLARISLSSTGFYATPKITWDRAKGTGRPFLYFTYGAAVAEVTIDTLTGETRLDRVDILHDVGRSLNPAIDVGQIEGGFVQGMGWLTMEELVWSKDGVLRTHAPSTYKIPCASDIPADFRVALWDGANREDTIHKSKAVGEPPVMLANAVFSAIFDAVASLKPGVIPELDAPATPEAILRAVEGMSADRPA